MTQEITLKDETASKLRQYADREGLLNDDVSVNGIILRLLDETGKTDESVEAARERIMDDYQAGSSDDATLAERRSSMDSDEARLSGAEQAEIARQRSWLRDKYVND